MRTVVMLAVTVLAVVLVLPSSMSAQTAPPIPTGLWANLEEGMIVRIEPCGDGFCGAAAGVIAKPSWQPKKGVCGQRILSDFRWNARAGRWDGRMQPPDRDRTLSSSITVDRSERLQLQARVALFRKTLSFERFAGTVDSTCAVL
jgi:uncharacterized protein (DUF2147 family)